MENNNKDTFQDRLLKLIFYLKRINNEKSTKENNTSENNTKQQLQ